MLTEGRTDDGRMDAGVIGILIAHLGAFGSGELIMHGNSILDISKCRCDLENKVKVTKI